MKLIIIGSSSSGNGYALVSTYGEIFLIEAGIKAKTMRKAIDYRVSCISGCIVSHNHGDHAEYITPYSKLGFPVGCNAHVAANRSISHPLVLEEGKTYAFGSYRVTPFAVKHDVPNFGYLIYHEEMGAMLFATDTYSLPFKFRHIDHFLIEANYSDDILNANVRQGSLSKAQANRLMVAHMSLANCIKALANCDAAEARNIVLIHLSSRNSDAKAFQKEIASRFAVPTYIAEKNSIINL